MASSVTDLEKSASQVEQMTEERALARSLHELSFPAGRYRFEFEVTEPINFPEYAGSAIRGAFGWALRHIACMTRQRECRGCPLWRTCPYATLMETQPPDGHVLQKFSQIPHPYVIEPPELGARVYEPGEVFGFHVVLIGRAVELLPLVIYAMKKAFLRNISRGSAELESVSFVREDGDEELIYGAGIEEVADHDATLYMPIAEAPVDIALDFYAPLRLQENSRPLPPDEITARNLLMALVRRTALLLEFHCGHPLNLPFHQLSAICGTAAANTSGMGWFNWHRYSSRQRQKMNLGGNLGVVMLSNVSPALVPFVYAGQWLHVGKNATFGLGGYNAQVMAD